MTTDLVRFDDDTAQRRPRPPAPATTSATKAADVMSRVPVTVDQQTSLFAAWGELRGAGARHLVVIDEGMRPLGVLDERDIALEWPPGPLGAHRVPVHELLRHRSRPRVLGSDDIAVVARTMLTAGTDAVPVVAGDGRLLGLITARQYVAMIAALEAPAPGEGCRTARR